MLSQWILYSAQKVKLKNDYLDHVWKENKNTRPSDPSGIFSFKKKEHIPLSRYTWVYVQFNNLDMHYFQLLKGLQIHTETSQ